MFAERGGAFYRQIEVANFVPCRELLGKRGVVNCWSGILVENSPRPGNFSPDTGGHCPKDRSFRRACDGHGDVVLGCGKRAT
jgi:hypothetical protein